LVLDVYIEVQLQQSLKSLICFQIVFLQPQYFEGLLLSDESTFDSEPFLSNLLSAFVGKLLTSEVLSLTFEKAQDLSVSLEKRERTYRERNWEIGGVYWRRGERGKIAFFFTIPFILYCLQVLSLTFDFLLLSSLHIFLILFLNLRLF
jgi:hypothetical protein